MQAHVPIKLSHFNENGHPISFFFPLYEKCDVFLFFSGETFFYEICWVYGKWTLCIMYIFVGGKVFTTALATAYYRVNGIKFNLLVCGQWHNNKNHEHTTSTRSDVNNESAWSKSSQIHSLVRPFTLLASRSLSLHTVSSVTHSVAGESTARS